MDNDSSSSSEKVGDTGISKPETGPRLAIWEKFIKGEKEAKNNFFQATCKACFAKKNTASSIRGEKSRMESHFYSCKFVCEADKNAFRSRCRMQAQQEPDIQEPPTKKPRLQGTAETYFDRPLDKRDQAEFETRILEAFVSCNIPFAAVEDARFQSMMRLIRPSLELPSRHELVSLLESLVKAQGQAESDDCTLSDVGNIFADLCAKFRSLPEPVSSRLFAALERRWKRFYNVPVIVVAMFLDPNTRMNRFRKSKSVSVGTIGKWASGLYTRLFGEKPKRLMDSVVDYDEKSNVFGEDCLAEVSTTVRYWKLVKYQHEELARLAVHLFSCVVHAAAIERGWSQMGYVHTKGRSRMGLRTASALTSMRMQFQKEDRVKVAKPRATTAKQAHTLSEIDDPDIVVVSSTTAIEVADNEVENEDELAEFLFEQSYVENATEEELLDDLGDFVTLADLFL
ncbi:uncharacterized protein LOC129593106 [Paramacrobiotus metropolitanus]|uniref:uncharacterized protein LOC129593106 n=1 Tax=Paramacrobiotus metropolitanus TaxID=2943436 RepID=UPI002446485B|nr:uncharacterized protein LOC129593106 [Paramacrobiotus metropolitanus]